MPETGDTEPVTRDPQWGLERSDLAALGSVAAASFRRLWPPAARRAAWGSPCSHTHPGPPGRGWDGQQGLLSSWVPAPRGTWCDSGCEPMPGRVPWRAQGCGAPPLPAPTPEEAAGAGRGVRRCSMDHGPTGGSVGKESACSAEALRSMPGLGRSPGEGNGCLLQHSGLENSMDRGAWRAAVHGVPRAEHD